MKGLFLLMACLACSFVESSANPNNVGHYKGGSITWKADENNPNDVIIFYRLNFRHHYQNGYLHQPCTDEAIEDRTILSTEGSFRVGGQWISWAKYICTDYDDVLDWSAGYYIMPYTLQPGTTQVDINFEECCWPTNVANNGRDQGSGRGWNMVSTIDISPRPDTGRPNSPPVAGTFPVYRLYRGCKYTRYIRAWDADGDNIHCRWTDPERNECNGNNGDICGPMYVNSHKTKRGALLEEETCKITFNKRNPAGTYAMAVMVEDYAPSDPSTPLSRIPVQFLIEVHEKDGKCRKPTLLGEDGICTTIPAGRETRIPLRARSSSPQNTITSFETIKPSGVHVTPLSRVDGTDDEYSVTLSWIPTSDQIGRHVVCYEAEEDDKFSSDMFCIYINVVDAAEIGPQLTIVPHESVPSPGDVLVGNTVTVTYSKRIQKATGSVFISILDASSNVLFQVDSSSSDLTINGRSLTFSLPVNLPLQRRSSYTIRVDEAAAKSTVDCEAAPQGDEWSFVFESFCDGGYSPLVVSPVESVPAPGIEMFGNVVSVTYNKKIHKPATSAYVTIYDTSNSPVFRVDTSSGDVSVSGKTLSFTAAPTVPLEFQGRYRIRVDEGAVVSARDCEQGLPAMAEWDFVFVTSCPDGSAYEPLTVLPSESVPSPGENFAGQTMLIKYNKEIKKSTESAYITIFDEFDFPIYQVDTSSPDVSVNGKTLSFTLSFDLPLQFGGGYKILVGEGTVLSAQDCDLVLPPAAEWQFGFVTFCSDGQDYQPLSVLPMDSSPYPEDVMTGRVIKIAYNKLIRKPVAPAYVSLFDSANSLLFQTDTTSPDVTIIDGTFLSFTLPLDLPLVFQGVYKIRVDGWAAVSAQDCDVSRPDAAQWRFTFLTFCPDSGDGFVPLAVLPLGSHPKPGGNITGHDIIIQYNKPIQKPRSSAYITIVTSDDSTIFTVDTSSDEVTIIDTSLALSLPIAAAVIFGNDYRILVDAGAVQSVDECDVALPASADWRFKYIGRRLPGNIIQKPQLASQPTGNVDCRENFMQTFVSKRLVGDIDPSTMYLNEQTCVGRDYNQTHYVIGTSYNSCKTVSKVTDSGRVTIFENVVYVPPQPYTPGSEITRDHFIEIHLSCQLPTDRVNYLSFDPNVTTIVYYEKGYGKFNFSLRMFEDETYSTAYTARDYPIAVQQNHPMNFEGRVTCEGNCDLMIDTCWATPTSNPFDATRYPFITNGCPVDDTVQLLASPSSRQERFAVNSFAFLGDNIHGAVYVHCDMRICDASDSNSKCTMGCDTADQSPSESASRDDNAVHPVIPNRGDVPQSGWRGKRDVSSVGSSSAAYPSTSGQLRLSNQKTDLKSGQRQMAVNPDVVEIGMLGTILIILVVLVIMQCRRSGLASQKASVPSV